MAPLPVRIHRADTSRLAVSRVAATAGWQAPGLILVATLALLGFYYLARADAIGALRGGESWSAVTIGPGGAIRHFLLSGLLLGILPVVMARGIFGLAPISLGLHLGRWHEGIWWLVVGIPLAILAGKIGAGSAAIRAVYPLDPELTLAPERLGVHALAQFLYFGAWEVLFRGVLLFGLAQRVGSATANTVQTALSVLAHFGRPLEEVVAAVPAGLVFGWVDLRLRSVWYVALLHWLEGMSLNYYILAR